jgi:hypothetical protein
VIARIVLAVVVVVGIYLIVTMTARADDVQHPILTQLHKARPDLFTVRTHPVGIPHRWPE